MLLFSANLIVPDFFSNIFSHYELFTFSKHFKTRFQFEFQIRLFGLIFSKKDKWNRRPDLHNRIEFRNNETFFGPAADPVLGQAKVDESREIPATPKSDRIIKFVSSLDIETSGLEKFRWDDILESKVPRDYQLSSFIESLCGNTILVLPTGSGKTLVSSMLLARMCRENPSLIGLFVVHRIPLVFQQAEAIRSETGLRVIGLCGENITNHKVIQVGRTKEIRVFMVLSTPWLCPRVELETKLY